MIRQAFRSVLFWSHLAAGVAAGLVILVMSATGVLLTYERQLLELDERRFTVTAPADASPLPVDRILETVRRRHPDEPHTWLRAVNRVGAAVPVWVGPHAYLVDPYGGEILREGQGGVAGFFDAATSLHRWLAIEGDGQDLAQAITALSNLLLLFLIVTGVYLWLPRIWHWPVLKTKMFFNPRANNAKARDYNWHHVFGFWSLIPLFLVVLTATIFYFPWANALLYGAFGERPPVPEEHEGLTSLEHGDMSYAALMDIAQAHAAANGAADWHSIWMELGEEQGEVSFYIDRSLGNRPAFAYSLVLGHDDGRVLEVKRHDDWSRGDQAWDVARFLHTGEIFGFIGQTIAGLVSLAACLLVYTGLALAWRRLVAPLFSRR